MSFTLKVRYRDAAFPFGEGFSPDNGRTVGGDMSGYVTENEGNRCAQERTFNVKIAPAERIK